jgi:4-diphosphocytidyl-2-C-methyl-D-erythritol kinase
VTDDATATVRLTIRAFAKLNLTLEVLAKREDGYHEVRSILQTISLADTLTVEPSQDLTFTCTDPGLEGEHNLVVKAARILDPARGAAIHLEKAIPEAAGLGGGSADAAATLWALNNLWDLHLSAGRLQDLAASLGSDVPFFLEGGTAVASGRGEHLAPLPPAHERWFLLLHPRLRVPDKTRALYSRMHPGMYTGGRVTDELAGYIRRGGPIREAYLYSCFDSVAFAAFPELHDWRYLLLDVAPSRPHVAGSGPTLFIPVDNEAHGRRVAAAVEDRTGDNCPDLFVVQAVSAAREVLLELP